MTTGLGRIAMAWAAGWAMAASAANPYAGHWALTIPGGGAGWLGVEENAGALSGSILWGGGSVLPVASVAVEGDTLVVTRVHESKKPGPDGKPVVVKETETIRAKASGDALALTTERLKADGKKTPPAEFTGKRLPPPPPAPDLAKVKFGAPVTLFNGRDLGGWRLTNPGQPNGWSAQDGILINRPVQQEGKPKLHYGNLRTDAEFEDFRLSLEFRVPENGNSGVYLRGIYEIQVADSFGKPADSHGLGGLYSRITPTENAAKPAGEWQTMVLTLVDRHVTVVLNGKTVIDNRPALGCTGGALGSDPFRPGPIYLQGDHTGVDYRNLVLTPVAK